MGTRKIKSNKKLQPERTWESIARYMGWMMAIPATICAVLVIAVMPFYFREGYTHMGSDKSYFLRTGSVKLVKFVLPLLAVWAICRLAKEMACKRGKWLERLKEKLSLTDVFALFFAGSVILSYFCSNYKETALWGTTGWYMGMFPQLTLVSLYFLLRCFQLRAEWLLILSMPVSAVVFALGYLNRFDIWPLPMENSGLPLYISTIGNINWYCAYIVATFFVGVGLLWKDRGEKRWITLLLGLYVFLGFATLITQGSDSGIFALAVVTFVLFVLSAKDEEILQIRRLWLILLLLAVAGLFTMGLRLLFPGRLNYQSTMSDLLTWSPLPVILMVIAATGLIAAGKSKDGAEGILLRGMKLCSKIGCVGFPVLAGILVVMIAVNTIHPGSLGALSDKSLFTFDKDWGSFRGATWLIGFRCFWEQNFGHKLTGIGPDCMADFLYSDGSEALLEATRNAFENRRLTNAHCEILTNLVNMGVFGAVSYAGILLSAIVRLLRDRKKSAFALASGLCVLAYFANGLWSFQQSMGAAAIFAVMGLGSKE